MGFCLDSRTYHAYLFANSQDPVHTTPDQRATSPRTSIPFSSYPNSWAQWYPLIQQFWQPHCITTSEVGESRSKTQSQLQHCSDNLRQDEVGSKLVAPRTLQTQRQVYTNNVVGHGDRIRCINAGLGSESQQHQHGRTMGTTREVTPYQLPRVTGSISVPHDLCTHNQTILLRLDNVTAIAFLNRMGEGEAFRDTLQSGSAHLEMVLGEEYIHPCRTPPDALSISWRDQHPYLFPPFSLLSRCLEKINR